MLRTAIVLVLLIAARIAGAQQPAGVSNLRTRVIDASIPVQDIDSLTVALPLVSATDDSTGQQLDLRFFSIRNNLLYTDSAAFSRTYPHVRKARLGYRVLPVDLSAKISRLDTATIRRNMRPDAIEFD